MFREPPLRRVLFLFAIAQRFCSAAAAPDFGPNVILIDPSTANAQQKINSIFATQERAQFDDHRYAILFKPGAYTLDVQVGFYTQVLGLGAAPDDVTINGAVRSKATWLKGNATCNFWRSVENLAIEPTLDHKTDIWAVSQATALRRLHVKGNLTLFDGGWSSGGFLADCLVDGTIEPGSQQQWISRNARFGRWGGGGAWNLVFVGCQNTPKGQWPDKPYTIISQTPRQIEKPYLTVDASGRYAMIVPQLRKQSDGVSWENSAVVNRTIWLDDFFLANADRDSADTLNAALAAGKHLLLTPGVYHLDQPLKIDRPGTVVYGLGYATLCADAGNDLIDVADVDGVRVSGLILQAGAQRSRNLLQVGSPGGSATHAGDPICLQDLCARAGGAAAGLADCYATINASDVVAENLWLWRADHGAGAGWTTNPTDNGLIVNGNDVTIYGLFVEHTQKYQTLWNGERGRVFMYQSEMPYDPPSQPEWGHDGVGGYASYKVADGVKTHSAFGVGVYCVFGAAPVIADSAIEVPPVPGVTIEHAIAIRLSGKPESGIRHVINDQGDSVIHSFASRIDRWPIASQPDERGKPSGSTTRP